MLDKKLSYHLFDSALDYVKQPQCKLDFLKRN